jgi:hypothetical protein
MTFDINRSMAVLSRTPATLEAMLVGLPNEWTQHNEGGETWSPHDVIGHLIYNELTDWIPRINIILSNKGDKSFEPFDRFAHLKSNQGRSIEDMLLEFKELRIQNLRTLTAFNLNDVALAKTGIHPDFGEVSLSQLLSAWVVHDLGHIAQISRVMAKQYTDEVGPWINYLGILAR